MTTSKRGQDIRAVEKREGEALQEEEEGSGRSPETIGEWIEKKEEESIDQEMGDGEAGRQYDRHRAREQQKDQQTTYDFVHRWKAVQEETEKKEAKKQAARQLVAKREQEKAEQERKQQVQLEVLELLPPGEDDSGTLRKGGNRVVAQFGSKGPRSFLPLNAVVGAMSGSQGGRVKQISARLSGSAGEIGYSAAQVTD